ncbi:DUF3347 domain-containing protein [Aquimarina aquimarini]|uniref:DUF3347 domain-containing protein n=1 Tax=Aquimarina aquimarini TaxID=1191734 RepID=UPI00131F198E|nr:DUF3347 domain-containing protein [Aquimarina aquimarini]
MKTTVKFFITLLLAGFVCMSCKTDKKTKPVDEQGLINKDLNATDSKSEVTFEDAHDQKVYNLYLSIKAALVNSKSKEVQAEAKKLEATLGDSEGDAQFKAVSKLVSLTKDISKQRDFFVALTEEMERVIGESKIISGEVYKQFCPMAFDGKGGYWLSDSKEIRNPYFGNKMLVCGDVEEVFK